MILLCYDGSPDATSAIEKAGELMLQARAIVVTVWEPFMDYLSRRGGGVLYWPEEVSFEDVDAGAERSAREQAQEGARRARDAGLRAEARAAMRAGSVAETILSLAEELQAQAIVLGTRGRSGYKAVLLGSVSHEVVQHADRPVIVVPSPALAARRAARWGE